MLKDFVFYAVIGYYSVIIIYNLVELIYVHYQNKLGEESRNSRI
jgi:hypothetical protein